MRLFPEQRISDALVFRVIGARFIGREVSEIRWLAAMQICELSSVGSRAGCSGAIGLFRPESGGGKGGVNFEGDAHFPLRIKCFRAFARTNWKRGDNFN